MQTFSVQNLDEFNVIGISVRTSNKDGNARKDIGALWKRFMSEGLMNSISSIDSDEIYCVYTDYESDANGPYNAIIGCKVKNLNSIPEGFIGKLIPAASYHVYSSSGNLNETVPDTWQLIWSTEQQRAYIADFDVYGKDGVVKTFVTVL